jgi:hypothetical protein
LRKYTERVFPASVLASISEDMHLSWFTKILAKDDPLQILIGWTGQAGRLLNLTLPIRKKIKWLGF